MNDIIPDQNFEFRAYSNDCCDMVKLFISLTNMIVKNLHEHEKVEGIMMCSLKFIYYDSAYNIFFCLSYIEIIWIYLNTRITSEIKEICYIVTH